MYDAGSGGVFRARLAQRELKSSMRTDEFEILPVECRRDVPRASKQLLQEGLTRHAGKFAATDLDARSWICVQYEKDVCQI